MRVQAPTIKTNSELLNKLLKVRSAIPELAGKRTDKFSRRLYTK